jgi:hypothetical protein
MKGHRTFDFDPGLHRWQMADVVKAALADEGLALLGHNGTEGRIRIVHINGRVLFIVPTNQIGPA